MIKKIVHISIFILLYFTIVIPFRNMSMSYFKETAKKEFIQDINIFQDSPRYFSVSLGNENREFVARVPFGMNFFIGIIGLIFISATRKFFFIEVGVQILFGIIIFSSFLYGVKGHPLALQISDMSSIYFLPLSSLFMVVLGFIEKKSLSESHEAKAKRTA